ncbi:unnamed protein product [Mytilus coruscus]|uniref:Fido domain-containing protein n=1 Tax=Mytilus coruscus TaxID=42192 RepID=A0A6J8CVP2_MYTCO|nr:unnamed protein product [Mytilus coruscus]
MDWDDMACRRFLTFEPIDEPSWRKRDSKYECVPTVKEMIKDIVNYHTKWLRKQRNSGKNSFVEAKREMMMEFLFRVQQGEDIGVNDQGTFEQVFNAEMKYFEKTGQKRECSESGKDLPRKKIRNESPNNEQRSDQDSLPDSFDVKDYIIENLTDKGNDENNKINETRNLLRGYWHLKHELKKLSDEEQSNYVGEIDVETCIQDCHGVLMRDLLDETKTQPGKFSVLPRSANFDGKDFFYPSYATEEIAFQAVDTIVLEYNKMVMEISKIKNKHEKLEHSLKCATVLLFGFLTLHPFSDGNGRLARLLCSHCLKVFCPFPTSIYNVFSHSTRDDYLRALVNARQHLNIDPDQLKHAEDAIKEAELILEQKPNELCSLVIESNWFTWRQFLHRIGEDILLFEFEKTGNK